MQPLGNRIAHLVGKLPHWVKNYIWKLVENHEVCVCVGVCVCWCVFQQGGVADCDECTRLPSLVRPCTRQRRLQPGNLSALHSFLMIACLFPAGTCKIVMLFHALSVLCSHCLCLRLLQWLRSAHWLCSCLTWQAEDLPAGSAAAGRVSRRGAAAAALPPAPAQPLSSAHR